MKIEIEIEVLMVRAHSSVICRRSDADHHRQQWAIQIRLTIGNEFRTWWEWMLSETKPSLEEATQYAATQLVRSHRNTTIDSFDPLG